MSAAVSDPLARPVAVGFGRAVLGHGFRLVRRGAVIVLAVAAGMSALVVQQHRSLFADGVDAAAFRALAENPAIRILFGRPVGLEDPGGFTVWRTGTPLAVVIAVWAMLAVIRITRGDEEAGRWDILAAGRYRLSRLVGLHLAVVAAGTVLVGVAVTVAMVTAGADPAGAVLYGAVLALIGMGAAAWGALAGQLAGDRRRAATLAAAGIGAGLLARMVADGVDTFAWLHWVTPFGLLGLTEPFTANRTAPLAVLASAAAVFAFLALVAGRRRDLGDGLVVSRASYRAWTVLLRSVPRFAARRSLGPVTAWGIGIGLYFLVVGLLASSVTVFLAENPVFAELAAQAGFGSLTTVTGYVASLFAVLAIPLGLYAASRISASGADEEARMLTLLFSAFTAGIAVISHAPPLHWLITLAGYFGLLFVVTRLRNSAWGLLAVFALTGFLGYTLGPILSLYLALPNGPQLVMTALAGTGAIFLALSGYALVSRKDFSFMGAFLMVGMLVAFLASIGAVLFSLPMLSLAVSAMVILLMSGMILWQTSEIIHGGETNYIMATVTLYITIFNLFVNLLQILGVMSSDD